MPVEINGRIFRLAPIRRGTGDATGLKKAELYVLKEMMVYGDGNYAKDRL